MKTKAGLEYKTKFTERRLGLVMVRVTGSPIWLTVGYIMHTGKRNWQFTAFGVYFNSGVNFNGERPTWLEAARQVVTAVEPKFGFSDLTKQ